MNFMKQSLNFELNFLSNRIPYTENAKRNGSDGKTKYFCVYRSYFNDGIKIYKVEPNRVTIISIKNNNIIVDPRDLQGKIKIKPIICIDQENGCLYFVIKENSLYSICSFSEKSKKDLTYYKAKHDKSYFQNYYSKLIVHRNNIFIVQQKKITKFGITTEKIKTKKHIIAATCYDNSLVLFSADQLIKFYDINSLKIVKELDLNHELFFSDTAYIYLNNNLLNLYSVNNKFIIKKLLETGPDSWLAKGQDTSFYNFNAIQEINQNFIDKYTGEYDGLEKKSKYKELLHFVSEISFPDNSYEGDILFFGPSIYIPLKKNVENSLYLNLNRIKNESSFSDKITKYLEQFSKNGNLEKLKSKTKKILSDEKGSFMGWDKNEVDYLLKVIELPKSINEESLIPSSLMPNFLNFIIAEILNTFLNLLIIQGLANESIHGLDDNIEVYSTLYRIISSDLVKYNIPKGSDDDDDDDNVESRNVSNNDECLIQSSLYILNSSFSPLSLREQLYFLYNGNTTFSKLSYNDILIFNSIFPEHHVEQRILDVAKAYLEANDYDMCIKYLKKIDMDNEDLDPIQNIYISHLLKLVPDDFEQQFKILQTFKKRLPKSMYKSLYIISLKANQFSTAVDEFYSIDSLQNFAREVKKNRESLGQYEDTIVQVLKQKNLVIELISNK